MNQQTQDAQHLKLLSIFHYVVDGIAGLVACFPILHLLVGISVLASSLTGSSPYGPGALFGLFFVVIAGSIILFGWAFAVCVILTGIFIARRKHYLFCLVMAGVECMFTPPGTVLGVFTIITLLRPSVKELFEGQAVGVA